MLSIIIPVFNAERYISRCVDSIIGQSFADWELLLVDDGSTDNTPLICDEYAARNTKIRVIHKKNGGVSSARNVGISNAKGDWIWFIDADDYILEGAKFVIESALTKDCQAVALSFIQEVNSCEAYPYLATCELDEGIYTGKLLINIKSTSPTVWSFLFQRDVILRHGIQMSSDLKYGEDKIFILEYLSNVDKVLVLGTPVYRYVFCETSAVRQNFMKNEREIDDQLASILILLNKSRQNRIDCRVFRSQIFYIITQFVLLCSTSNIGYQICRKKYCLFLDEFRKVGYFSLLLIFIKILLILFYYRPYLLKRRFMFLYFSVNRKRVCC